MRPPEDTDVIDRRHPHSCCRQALHIGYPSASACARGIDASSDIEIHGLGKGTGCATAQKPARRPDGMPIVIKHSLQVAGWRGMRN
jgi:hypothetical protein